MEHTRVVRGDDIHKESEFCCANNTHTDDDSLSIFNQSFSIEMVYTGRKDAIYRDTHFHIVLCVENGTVVDFHIQRSPLI